MVNGESQKRYAFHFTEECPYGQTRWIARVVEVADHPTAQRLSGEPEPTVRNLPSDHPYSDLAAHVSAHKYDSEITATYWYAEYREVSSVKLSRAQDMVKVLGKLDRGLSKAYDESGNAAHFGQFVQRVARILGISQVIVRRDFENTSRSSYDYDRYRVLSLGEASDFIGRHIAEGIKAGKVKTY